MRLSVGITHLTPAWKILLEQIAPPCEELNSTIDWSTENYGCIIVSSTVSLSVKEKLKRYLTDGGSLLLETEVAKQILGTNSEPAFVDYIDTTNDSLFSSVASGSVGRKLNLPLRPVFPCFVLHRFHTHPDSSRCRQRSPSPFDVPV